MEIPKTREECEKVFNENDVLDIVFIKKSGEMREMTCTRKAFLIPPSTSVSGGKSTRPPSETSFPVFDLAKKEWRAFTIANLVSIKKSDNSGQS